MGWTGMHRDAGLTDREFFEAEFPLGLQRDGRILACATVASVFYAAVQNTPQASYAPGETWCLVVLMQRTRDYYNFTYKELSDSMGPAEDRCPVRILDLLTPTDSEYANEWRARCRANAAKREAARQIRPGAVLKFAQAFTFMNGETHDTFRLVGRSTFSLPDGRGRYRIPNWRDSGAYELVSES